MTGEPPDEDWLNSADGTGNGDPRRVPDPPTYRGKSCKGCLYYSSRLKSDGRNPVCVGLGRTLPQGPFALSVWEFCATARDRTVLPKSAIGDRFLEKSIVDGRLKEKNGRRRRRGKEERRKKRRRRKNTLRHPRSRAVAALAHDFSPARVERSRRQYLASPLLTIFLPRGLKDRGDVVAREPSRPLLTIFLPRGLKDRGD
ncbi:hypothetical protein GW17_00053227, partial [Ensete ventricosum]